MITDLDCARLIAGGLLPSPYPFYGSVLIKLRLSGSGVSFRSKNNEFVYRPRELYASWKFADRWRGVPVVESHPDAQVLDAESAYQTLVGIVTYAFPEGDELWGVARIFSKEAAAILQSGSYTTSPSVINPNGVMLQVGDDKFYWESEPSQIDHIALLNAAQGERGVWDKGDTTNLGVAISEPSEKENANG